MSPNEPERPGDLYWRVLAPVWESVSIRDDAAFARSIARVTPTQRVLFCVHFCQSEIRNGGFHQFFQNPTGVLAPEAAEGFEKIGMHGAADLLRRAMAFFGDVYPREQRPRRLALSRKPGATRAEWDPFYALDQPFYDALDTTSAHFERAADAYAATAE